MRLKYLCIWMLLGSLIFSVCFAETYTETRLDPVLPVPEEIRWLLEVASEEVGYHEGEHGWTKYGEWAGDPYAQWCAEFLCWCVSRVDELHGCSLLGSFFPLWSSSNTGRAWFIRNGRYAVRSGEVEDWGYEWLSGETEYLKPGSYIPQPGDYVFFTWTSGPDTDHVALVEYCTRDASGSTQIHVIEGNNPASVSRNVYPLSNTQILGFGTVHDLVEITMRYGNEGEKVRQLQEKLSYLGYLDPQFLTGTFGRATVEAVRSFQQEHHLRTNAIANLETQLLLNQEYEQKQYNDPAFWQVVDEEDE